MVFNGAINPHTGVVIGTFASIATNSSAIVAGFSPGGTCMVIGARYCTGANGSSASATTTGSAIQINIYKNASGTASRLGTFNSSGTTTASYTSYACDFTASSSTALQKLTSTDIVLAEFVGGAGANVSFAASWIALDVIYGYQA